MCVSRIIIAIKCNEFSTKEILFGEIILQNVSLFGLVYNNLRIDYYKNTS